MALKDLKEKAVKFGSGQPTNLGGRKKREPFINVLTDWLEKDGRVEFHPSTVKLLPNGNYQVQMPNDKMLATKFMQMAMKGDARFMEMYFKLFGDYKAEKHDVVIKNPFGGKSINDLSEADKKMFYEIADKI